MDMAQLEQDINAAWDDRDSISAATTGAVRDAVNAALGMLDNGS
ncbi:MAG: 2,3,4,5-tetrahydropyridine-2,6-dicarboxylate N-succinyltransferase, partial [Pseudomonadota bacterium]|nr:2,3,4,5-tetrahydropyridine-2,6-dicarboxylate N-succinyltransferase [Pseudomonadota bacterium]